MLEKITPLIITYNEAPNIERVLKKLLWAQRIVVIDSGSTDETSELAKIHSQVALFYRPFKDFASQCNFGLAQISTPWVLSLDADYVLSDELVAEMSALVPHELNAGYRARFVYRVYGRSLRGTLYPARTVLYQKAKALYKNEGHGHRIQVDGDIVDLNGVIYHDDRKPLARWISSQQRYAREEATYLLETPRSELSRIDKIRLMGWPAPLLVLVYTLFAKGCAWSGWAGWHYALQRLLAEALTTLEIVDRKLRERAQIKEL